MFEHATEALGNRGLARTRGAREPKVEVQRLREREREGATGPLAEVGIRINIALQVGRLISMEADGDMG